MEENGSSAHRLKIAAMAVAQLTLFAACSGLWRDGKGRGGAGKGFGGEETGEPERVRARNARIAIGAIRWPQR